MHGIALPFRMTPGDADVATVTGQALRQVHLGTIVTTRASSAGDVGELPWDPGRGCALDALRNAAASEAVGDFAMIYTEESIRSALPDEELLDARVDVTDRTIRIEIETKLAADASRSPRITAVSAIINR